MRMRILDDEIRVYGFIGYGRDGQPYIASPGDETWTIRRCNDMRAFDRVAVPNRDPMNAPLDDFGFTPQEFDEFTDDNEITWFDDGNGVFWYSADMMHKLGKEFGQ